MYICIYIYRKEFSHDGARMYNEVYILVYLVTFLCFNYVSVLCISVSDENKKKYKNFKLSERTFSYHLLQLIMMKLFYPVLQKCGHVQLNSEILQAFLLIYLITLKYISVDDLL